MERYYYTDAEVVVARAEVEDFYKDMREGHDFDADGFKAFLCDLISDGTLIPLPDMDAKPGAIETLTMYRTTITYKGETYEILLLPTTECIEGGPAISAYITPANHEYTMREMFTHDLETYSLGEIIDIAKAEAPEHIKLWF